MNAVRQYFHYRISGYNEQEYYYGQMLKDKLITEEYYNKNIKRFDQTERIINILRSSGISSKAMKSMRNILVYKPEIYHRHLVLNYLRINNIISRPGKVNIS